MSATEFAAWWGAVVATGVLVWDIIKWRLAGPKLRLTVNSGMNSFNIPEYEGKTLIVAHVVNSGDRPTTLTHMAVMQYANFWKRLRNKAEKTFLIPNPNLQQRIPYELKPGTTWMGIAVQNDDIEAMERNGQLICTIYHSHRSRPLKKRIRIKDSARAKLDSYF